VEQQLGEKGVGRRMYGILTGTGRVSSRVESSGD